MRTSEQWKARSAIGIVDLALGQLTSRFAAICRGLNDNTHNGALCLHAEAVSRQGLLGIVRVFLHLVVELVQPLERHRARPRSPTVTWCRADAGGCAPIPVRSGN